MENSSELLKEPLCIFCFPETVLPGQWQSINCAKIQIFFIITVKLSLTNIFPFKILPFLLGRIEAKYT